MAKGGNKDSGSSEISKPDISSKGIEKKKASGKNLEGIAMGLKSLSSANDEYAGFIFLCNGRTKPECFSYRVFGLPSFKIDVVSKIKQGSRLFLFDFDVKLLYGVYTAASNGTMNLEPGAFGGKFPAQVRFEISIECMPIPESNFKHAIKDNYQDRFKFRQDLSAEQVNALISLFRPLSPTSAPRLSSSSNDHELRRILQREIEEPNQPPGVSTPLGRHVNGLQYSTRIAHSPYQIQQVTPEGPPRSMHWARGEPSLTSQQFPSSMHLSHNSSYLLKDPHRSYSTGDAACAQQGFFDRHTNELLLNRSDGHPRIQPNDYRYYQNHEVEPSHGPTHILPHVSATPRETDKAPSSVLAAAYWVAVASEIPRSGLNQSSNTAPTGTGLNDASFPYKPPNLSSSSILDAYWAAKALEDTRQVQPGPPQMLRPGSTIFHEPEQVPSQSLSAPYWVAVASRDLNHPQYDQGAMFPGSHTGLGIGNQAALFAPGPQQPVYDPSVPQYQQLGLAPYGALNL